MVKVYDRNCLLYDGVCVCVCLVWGMICNCLRASFRLADRIRRVLDSFFWSATATLQHWTFLVPPCSLKALPAHFPTTGEVARIFTMKQGSPFVPYSAWSLVSQLSCIRWVTIHLHQLAFVGSLKWYFSHLTSARSGHWRPLGTWLHQRPPGAGLGCPPNDGPNQWQATIWPSPPFARNGWGGNQAVRGHRTNMNQ